MTETGRQWRRVKSALTRAENRISRVDPATGTYARPSSEDLAFARTVAADARETFEREGFPDWWSRVVRLETDIRAREGW